MTYAKKYAIYEKIAYFYGFEAWDWVISRGVR